MICCFTPKAAAPGCTSIISRTRSSPASPPGRRASSDNRTGFTAGAGLEYGLTENWSAKLEYDFYDFGSKTYQFTQTPVSISSTLNTLIFGLNYRFNWAGGWH